MIDGASPTMRGTQDGVRSPHPIVDQLPGLLQGDDFARRFTGGLDELWGNVLVSVDNLHAYFDPWIAPSDFVAWLATWVGVAIDENWPDHRQRALVAQIVDLYRWRGTARGLRDLVSVYVGVEPEIEDSGGVQWSLSPDEPGPGDPEPSVVIRLRVAEPERLDLARLGALVGEAVPAHVRHAIEVEAVP